MKFELFVALRYLRAKRKQAAISIITIISILGVTAGVTALIVALAISRGFREDLQSKLLRGTSHINVLPVDVNEGIANYPALVSKIKTVKGVRSATPAIYSAVLVSAARPDGIMLKGMAVDDAEFLAQGFFDVLQGSALDLAAPPDDPERDAIANGVVRRRGNCETTRDFRRRFCFYPLGRRHTLTGWQRSGTEEVQGRRDFFLRPG